MSRRRGYLPGGVGEAVAMFAGRMATAIQRYPTGRYGLVGSIPYELTEENPRALSPGSRRSLVWDTEQEVIDALLAIGVTRFQRADCSWYQPPTVEATMQQIADLTAQDAPPLAEVPFTLRQPISERKAKQSSLF